VFGKHLAKKDLFQTKICWTLFFVYKINAKLQMIFAALARKVLMGDGNTAT
jgi:hypothetical protein